MSRRTDRVGDLLRQELSELILRQLADPRVRLTTVAAVAVSADLRHARVSVSVMGTEDERRSSLEALRHARGYLRHQLAQRLRLRVIPELDFVLDRGAEHSRRIADILEEIRHDDESS
jgi:ribosome-binding factor A